MNELIGGVDEAGRGSFLGRVYAGCVIWDDTVEHKWLKDSKKLTKEQRFEMRDFIIDNCIAWGIGYSNNEYIDKHGIVKATMNAMHQSIDGIGLQVDHLYIDGNYYKPSTNSPKFTCFVKGDSLYKCISAASILAKTFHDDHITDLCGKCPELDSKYNLLSNMGYGTQNHINGLKENGLVINEWMANNTDSEQDEDGEFNDWIEIYNTTNQSINLAGYFISNKANEATKYQFPNFLHQSPPSKLFG